VTAGDAEADKPGSWEWAVCGASVTGWRHVEKGLGCDDAFAYAVAGDYLVVAIADGAGSVSGTSAWGAFAACQSVLLDATDPEFINDFRTGSEQRAEVLMRWLFEGAMDRVKTQAEFFGLPVAKLSTTLSVAVADPEMAAFGQIGDGIIVAEHAESIRTVLTETKDEYANTTWFLQSNGALDDAFQTAVLKNVAAFALSTDGMSYKITNIATGEAYEPFFKGSWTHVRSGSDAADFAALLRGIQDDQTGDDKTMVLAAMRWEDDTFHPSARPISKTVVHSASPAKPELPGAQEPTRSDEPAPAAVNGSGGEVGHDQVR
jgi:hypothetical protein